MTRRLAPRSLHLRARALLSALVTTGLLVACAATPHPSATPDSSLTSTATATTPETTATASPRAATVPALTVGKPAWVAVSVSTLWRTPDSPRPVDAPALARPARIREWLAAMTLDQRRALNGRADTQALLGERVRVVRLDGRWAKVVVPDQPSPRDPRGYPGWVPTRQLTARPPADTTKRATVVGRTTWLRTDDAAATRVFEISYGSRLPYLGTVGKYVRVVTPLGAVRRIRAGAVSVHLPGRPALPQTGADLVRAAKMFTGLPYLWSGTSGFGFDCSGLTWNDYRTHGITIPRDAAPQSESGTPVKPANRKPGDLLFYATDGLVHHVAMYAGDGMMVHSPHTGATVQTIPISTPAYAKEYAGARRYLP